MPTRTNYKSALSGLDVAERDFMLLTIAAAIERMSDHGQRTVSKSFVRYLNERHGLARAWSELPEERQTHAMAFKILDAIPSQIRARKPRRRSNALSRRMDWLAGIFGLDRIERDGLEILIRTELLPEWATLVQIIDSSGEISVDLLALLTGHGKVTLDQRFHPGSRLARTGIIRSDEDGEIRPGSFLMRLARVRASTPEALAKRLMPEEPASRLADDDFAHLGPEAEMAMRLLETGQGASILLYGPPGTGKTEFALHAARTAGFIPVMAGMEDESGLEPNRRERMAHLVLLREMMRSTRTHAVIADEADDMLHFNFGSDSRRDYSKAWLNAFVDAPGPPTIWIVNDRDTLAETTIRRMDCAVRFDPPPASARGRIVARHARKAGLSFGPRDIARIAALPASPAILETAVNGAARVHGDSDDVCLIGNGLLQAQTGFNGALVALPAVYHPALACADCDLEALSGRLRAAPDKGWSLLLHGPSGTGKSAYARHLAEAMGMDLQIERGSDLLDAFVGGTERNIAAAFARAARQKAVLLIDEADDFLTDRRDAVRSWERTMVSEMLRQMEQLRTPFIATTNLADRLDPATRRRFTVQAGFTVLNAEQARAQFQSWFTDAAPEDASLDGLTPGDFALVARRAGLLGETCAGVIAKWLQEEADARNGSRNPLGFRL